MAAPQSLAVRPRGCFEYTLAPKCRGRGGGRDAPSLHHPTETGDGGSSATGDATERVRVRRAPMRARKAVGAGPRRVCSSSRVRSRSRGDNSECTPVFRRNAFGRFSFRSKGCLIGPVPFPFHPFQAFIGKTRSRQNPPGWSSILGQIPNDGRPRRRAHSSSRVARPPSGPPARTRAHAGARRVDRGVLVPAPRVRGVVGRRVRGIIEAREGERVRGGESERGKRRSHGSGDARERGDSYVWGFPAIDLATGRRVSGRHPLHPAFATANPRLVSFAGATCEAFLSGARTRGRPVGRDLVLWGAAASALMLFKAVAWQSVLEYAWHRLMHTRRWYRTLHKPTTTTRPPRWTTCSPPLEAGYCVCSPAFVGAGAVPVPAFLAYMALGRVRGTGLLRRRPQGPGDGTTRGSRSL